MGFERKEAVRMPGWGQGNWKMRVAWTQMEGWVWGKIPVVTALVVALM
jgi:hypothetical protein